MLVTTNPLQGGAPERTVYYVAEKDADQAKAIIAEILAPNEEAETLAILEETLMKALGQSEVTLRKRAFPDACLTMSSLRPWRARFRQAIPSHLRARSCPEDRGGSPVLAHKIELLGELDDYECVSATCPKISAITKKSIRDVGADPSPYLVHSGALSIYSLGRSGRRWCSVDRLLCGPRR